MKRLIPSLVFAMLASASSMAVAAEQTIKLSVPGMTCVSCPYMVKQAISAVDGIKAVEATMEDRSATVIFEDTVTSIEAIQQATANIGYPSSLLDEKSGS
ncbi:mercury resistance system periplasmic binding protein MerP [Sneathiella sp.]|uniref:mercury resistance system periplasmic binding protein MerP n=1 Tax=Sneathiella sp. TaxID=1964365 RepID=UPI0035651FED